MERHSRHTMTCGNAERATCASTVAIQPSNQPTAHRSGWRKTFGVLGGFLSLSHVPWQTSMQAQAATVNVSANYHHLALSAITVLFKWLPRNSNEFLQSEELNCAFIKTFTKAADRLLFKMHEQTEAVDLLLTTKMLPKTVEFACCATSYAASKWYYILY